MAQSPRYLKYNTPNGVYYKSPFCVEKKMLLFIHIFIYTFRKHLGEFRASKGNCACLEEVTPEGGRQLFIIYPLAPFEF